MILLEFLCFSKGLSRRELGKRANVDPNYLSNAVNRGMLLYPKQAQQIADVLEWQGDPMMLHKEIEITQKGAAEWQVCMN